jgi:hypothetical protein
MVEISDKSDSFAILGGWKVWGTSYTPLSKSDVLSLAHAKIGIALIR